MRAAGNSNDALQWIGSPLCEVASLQQAFAPDIRISDCTLRNGEQRADIVFSSKDKIDIVRRLDAFEVYGSGNPGRLGRYEP
jgi:hypothetical protein